MLNELEKIKDSELLNGITVEELSSMLGCLRGVIKKYQKDELVLSEGEKIEKFGLLIEGRLRIVLYDYLGNKTINVYDLEINNYYLYIYLLKKDLYDELSYKKAAGINEDYI